jgi:hypothetical protein
MSEINHGWDSCPQGELSRLAANLTFRRRMQTVLMGAVILVAAGGVAGAAWLAHDALISPAPNTPCAPCSDSPATCDTPPAVP